MISEVQALLATHGLKQQDIFPERPRDKAAKSAGLSDGDSSGDAASHIATTEQSSNTGLNRDKASKRGRKSTKELDVPGRIAHASKGSKVPAKYFNLETGEKWSGRGVRPQWVREALASGKTLKDLELS